jgi:hypothetical protein
LFAEFSIILPIRNPKKPDINPPGMAIWHAYSTVSRSIDIERHKMRVPIIRTLREASIPASFIVGFMIFTLFMSKIC